jgi:Phage Terminase
MDDDPFVEATIRKANPAFGDFLSAKEVMGTARDAQRMPAREASYRNLILNQRVEASSPFVQRSLWMQCAAEPKPLDGVEVYGGLDLSSVADLTALVLIGMVGNVWQVHPTFWLPDEGLSDKGRMDHAPYDMWRRHGWLNTCPGKTVSYEYVAAFLKQQFDQLNIRKLAFDRWNMKHLKPWLLQVGFSEQLIEDRFVEFGQGTQSMSPALRDLEAAIIDRNQCRDAFDVGMAARQLLQLGAEEHRAVRRLVVVLGDDLAIAHVTLPSGSAAPACGVRCAARADGFRRAPACASASACGAIFWCAACRRCHARPAISARPRSHAHADFCNVLSVRRPSSISVLM